ncbi:hypothetical protein R1sor_025151 [Riccia sorocarpa]|uniref:Reverse transcriptase domain-containing protein n=1 Tax=Riccia sorocarpa TaxID=122646 RepID=A0ABD3G8B1_9MARC
MVEVLEGSKGKSPLTTGAEARAWKHMAQRKGLIDAYMSAIITFGGVFTRQAFCEKFTEEQDHEDLIDLLKKAQEKLRKRDHEDARAWRLRSRSLWLKEGEAPTRYFCSQTKAKFARETIQALKNDEGVKTTAKKEGHTGTHQSSSGVFLRIPLRSSENLHGEGENSRQSRFYKQSYFTEGCEVGLPAGSYLFTFSTQVLMDMLQKAKNDSRIIGLRIREEDQLLHQLFADDMGITLQLNKQVFHETKKILANYEKASGARLNLSVMVIIDEVNTELQAITPMAKRLKDGEENLSRARAILNYWRTETK